MIFMPKEVAEERPVTIVSGKAAIEGDLAIAPSSRGIVLFAHGSGSSRFSSRNRYVAQVLHRNEFSTLLIDLLTKEEEAVDEMTAEFRFNTGLLARRLMDATEWVMNNTSTRHMSIGYFGASTGSAAALIAAASFAGTARAVVSRGGRPDLAGNALKEVKAPTLFIVGSEDHEVIELNRTAMADVTARKKISIVPGATHLFEEPGALEEVAWRAVEWYKKYL